MSIFKKIFGSGNDASNDASDSDYNPFQDLHSQLPVDEQFTHNFKKNGGKFLYCENVAELNEQFENILEENDWFESEAMCLEPRLFKMLEENNIKYQNVTSPKFFFASCENLIAEDGSILFSSNQIKQNKPNQLPDNIVLVATTSQIILSKSDGLREIKKDTLQIIQQTSQVLNTLKKVKEEDFLHYGSSPKKPIFVVARGFIG